MGAAGLAAAGRATVRTVASFCAARSARVTGAAGAAVRRTGSAAVRVVSASLAAGFISPGVNFLLATLAPIVAKLLSGVLEGEVNKMIVNAANAAVAGLTPPRRLAGTACICAQRVVATPAGVAVSAVLSYVILQMIL